MLRITSKKGFHITFENGYTASVQFGPGNYCDHYNRDFEDSELCASEGSFTAECAVWGGDGDMLETHPLLSGGVSNRSTPAEVLELLNWAASQEKP